MSDRLTTIVNVQVLVCTADGKKLGSEQDALDLIGETWQTGAELILMPLKRVEDAFFQLKTGLAGQIVQKFVNYRKRLVILGDISGYIDQSRAFKDFVYEANRGEQVWFIASLQELDERLNRAT